MQKKFFILFLLFSFFGIIFNENCTNATGELNRNDCFILSDEKNYCCFNYSSKGCTPVTKENFQNKYTLDCGISEDNFGEYEFGEYHPKQAFETGFQSCGKNNPKTAKDCTDFSEINNSCCYFTKGNQKGCFVIGRKIANGKYKGSYDNINFDCWSFNLIFHLCSMLLIFFQL